jgi:hypothetical protein
MAGFKSQFKRKLSTDHLLLLIILIAGAFLRFWNYSNLPYSFDEFSALFRTRFDNFSDLIKYGVVTTDTHPAGVQVFLYYWTKLFGESERVVKLPFILFGLGAIIYGYKVGKLWFNSTVGLFTALFLSVLQYPITYSQFARPYSSGLFLSLLMVWFWTHTVFYPDKKSKINRIGFVISAVLCAYNHHFSMFLAVLAGLSGLFFIKWKNLLAYLLLCFSAIVLYLPHISILLSQMQKGGVEEWLGKPTPGFILDYLGYILHFSKALYGLTVVLIVGGIFLFSQKIRETNKFRLLAFLWFLITFLVGYFYSVYVNALLQYSVLIFVFPFLVLFVFSFYRDIHNLLKIAITIVFMGAAIFTLIHERQHYYIMYHSVYRELLVESEKITQENPGKKVAMIIYEPENIRKYYVKQLPINDSNFIYINSTSDFVQFRELINQQDADLLVLGLSLSPNIEYKSIAEERYPYLIKKINWFKGDLCVYSKILPDADIEVEKQNVKYYSLNTFDRQIESWDPVLTDLIVKRDDFGDSSLLFINGGITYSPSFKAKLNMLSNNNTDEIWISVDLYLTDKVVNPALVCDFVSPGKKHHWHAMNVADFITEPGKSMKAYCTVKLVDLDVVDPETEVNIYLWNRNQEEFYIDNFKIEVREGNPLIYGLFEKI